jgi:glycosyltransferase involved in cell wall biosynthesis
MKIAYISILPADDINAWSGLNYHILQCLRAQRFEVDLIGPLYSRSRCLVSKAKSELSSLCSRQRHLWTRDAGLLRRYGEMAAERLRGRHYDLLFSPGTEPIAFLPDYITTPLVFWTDAPFGAMLDYYPWYKNLSHGSIRDGMECDRRALQRSIAAVYSSEWAANAAVQAHGADPSKVTIIPFGANVTARNMAADLESIIEQRLQHPWRFLFVGVEWERKGGDRAVAIVSELNRRGYSSELIVVGCDPRRMRRALPEFVKIEGFLDKRTPAGLARLNELYRSTLFFLMPSVAEAYGLVFCEASAHGVPCLSARTGGIPSIVEENINGYLFPPEATPAEVVDRILNAQTRSAYRRLAYGALDAYERKLNWMTSGGKIKNLIERIVPMEVDCERHLTSTNLIAAAP